MIPESLGQFHFLRPAWLLALVPLALLARRAWRRRRARSPWARVCDPELAPYVLAGGGGARAWIDPIVLAAAAAVAAIMALAGPAWERLPQPVYEDPSALVIALDLSRSMDATDVVPSRLARARFELADLLERRRTGLTALLVYAAAAFPVTPLTDDTRTILAQLPVLTSDLMPAQGSRADRALELALELLRRGGARSGDVLLVTDGVSAEVAAVMERELRDAPVRLFVLGIGTEAGAPVPGGADGPLRDADGEPVVTRLQVEPLAALARAGAGRFVRHAPDNRDIDALLAAIESRHADGRLARTELTTERWRDRGPWLLLAALPLGALLFRRGYALALAGCVLMPLSPSAVALEWEALWLRPDQRAAEALAEGDAERAARLAEDPAWAGVARYRRGDYAAAAQAFADRDSALAHYNRGNALARLGRYEEALAAYERALELEPDDADARYNRDLLRALPAGQSGGGEGGTENRDDDDRGGSGNGGSPPPDAGDAHDRSGKRGDGSRAPEHRGSSEARPDREETAGERGGRDDRGDEREHRPDRGEETASRPPSLPRRDSGLADRSTRDEQAQAEEQWLRRVPDDPGGLLRRKFLYQYRRSHPQRVEERPW